MSNLWLAQAEFAYNVPALISTATVLGFNITLGDAYRDPRCPYGHPNSKHKMRLAIDLNLFRHGVYLTETIDHEELGLWWEEQGGIWGGRFNDGNHYSWPFP